MTDSHARVNRVLDCPECGSLVYTSRSRWFKGAWYCSWCRIHYDATGERVKPREAAR